jgi:hypothetical protein
LPDFSFRSRIKVKAILFLISIQYFKEQCLYGANILLYFLSANIICKYFFEALWDVSTSLDKRATPKKMREVAAAKPPLPPLPKKGYACSLRTANSFPTPLETRPMFFLPVLWHTPPSRILREAHCGVGKPPGTCGNLSNE